jgi:hypothetical protein
MHIANADTNPYGRFVEGRDIMRSLEDTPQRIASLVRQWPTARLEMPWAPGKWNARQILVHLAHAEMVLATRFRFALAERGSRVQPFDQDAWMDVEGGGPAMPALETYLALRSGTLALAGLLSERDFDRSTVHPDWGEVSAAWLLAWIAGHELNHLPQFETIDALRM